MSLDSSWLGFGRASAIGLGIANNFNARYPQMGFTYPTTITKPTVAQYLNSNPTYGTQFMNTALPTLRDRLLANPSLLSGLTGTAVYNQTTTLVNTYRVFNHNSTIRSDKSIRLHKPSGINEHRERTALSRDAPRAAGNKQHKHGFAERADKVGNSKQLQCKISADGLVGAYCGVVVVASGDKVVVVEVVTGADVVGFIVTGFWNGLCDSAGNNGLYSAIASALEFGNRIVYNDGL